MSDPVELPEKIFFKIGEVSRIVGAEPHVLRYWEKEFPSVRPRKSRGGQRLYRRADVESLLRIKTLLRDEGFTISGAKKKLAADRAESRKAAESENAAGQGEPPPPDEATQRMMDEVERLKGECLAIRQDRATTARRLATTEETLRQVRREIDSLLRTVVPAPEEPAPEEPAPVAETTAPAPVAETTAPAPVAETTVSASAPAPENTVPASVPVPVPEERER